MGQNPILLGGVESPHSIYEQLLVTASSDARAEGRHPVGTKGGLPDGRVFYYCKSGDATFGNALVRGQLAIASTLILSGHGNDVAAVARSVGERIVTVDFPSTDTPANFYKDGYFWINDANGEGQYWRVVQHTEHDTSVSGSVVTVTLDGEVATALTTSSEASIIRNPFDHVGPSTTSSAEYPLGVPLHAFTASGARTASASTGASVTSINHYFGWLQTAGPACILAGDTAGLGVPVMSGDTAGEVFEAETAAQGAGTAAIDLDYVVVGHVLLAAAAATEYTMVDLILRY